MKRQLIIDILEFLETENGVPEYKNILPFIQQHKFKKPNDLNEIFDNSSDPMRLLVLDLLEDELVENFEDSIYHICNSTWTNPVGDKRFQFWFDDLEVKLRLNGTGQDFLDEERVKNILVETNKSIIKSGQSAIDTNELVKTNIYIQIGIGVITMIAIGFTAVYSVMAYKKEDPIALQRIDTLLQQQVQQLDSIRLLQKERNTYLKIMASKTLTKSVSSNHPPQNRVKH